MVTQTRVHLQTLVLLTFVVHLSLPVCVEVPSATEAAVNKTMKLTCISCLKREEIKATTLVDWFFTPEHENSDLSNRTHIYKYANGNGEEVNRVFQGRLGWNGSKDLQDVSIVIRDVTYKDSGFYECHVERQFVFESYFPSFTHITNITLKVKEQASRDTTALYSEIMMYVLLVFLTFWLLVEMVYCYRKISKSDEQAQDTATNYLAIPSEQKANPDAPVTE